MWCVRVVCCVVCVMFVCCVSEDVLCVVFVERVVLCVYGMLRGKYQMCSAYCEKVLCVCCVCVLW